MMTDKTKSPESGRWQFSLRTLFGAMTVLGVVSFFIVNWQSYPIWILEYATTLAFLVYSTIAGVFRRGRSQAFWGGFAIAGWTFLLLGVARIGAEPGSSIFLYVFENLVGESESIYHHVDANFYELYPYIMLLLGYLGGLVARYFYSTRADES